MITMARDNSRILPIHNILSFEAKDFVDQKAPSEKGVLVSNPPYGERLELEELEEFYKGIGDFSKCGQLDAL